MDVAVWSLIVAVVALLIAVLAMLISWRSDSRAARSFAVTQERRDVVWTATLSDEGRFELRNAGQDAALGVHFDVTMECAELDVDFRFSKDLGRVEPGEGFMARVEGTEAPPRPEPPSPPQGFLDLGSPMAYPVVIDCSVHVSWRSPLGGYAQRDLDWREWRWY